MLLTHVNNDSSLKLYSTVISLKLTSKLCRIAALSTRRFTPNDISLTQNKGFTSKLFKALIALTSILILITMTHNRNHETTPHIYSQILLSGDIHPNPGPSSHSELSDESSNISTSSYINLINGGLSIMHLNIQSITSKLDILEIESQPYDVLVFTETWLSQTTPNEDILIPNFNPPFRCDRQNRIGGGVAIYVRDSLFAKQRNDLSINGLESLWIELHIDHRKLLLGGIYRPPNSNNTEWNLLEESIDRAFNQPADNILVTGDFNIDILNGTPNKINRLITSYSAEQLITTATHFTDTPHH